MNSPRQRFTDLNSVPLRLNLGSYEADILHWGFIDTAWWRNYLHVHSFFEICYVFAGQGTFKIGGETLSVKGGDVFVAKPDEPHEIIADKTDPLGIYFWSYTLVPPAKRQSGHGDIDTLLQAFTSTLRRVNHDMAHMQGTLELLTDEVVKREAGYLQALEGLVIKLLLDTARAVTTNVPVLETLRPPADAAVAQMLRYLKDNFDRPVNVQDVAAQVHLSERHARRLFLQSTSTSMKQYLTTLRLDVAKQRLLGDDTSVSEIAYAVGFNDVRHFSTIFRSVVGVSPTDFREQGGTRFL
jgi:AraC-like DNA-binding protein